MQRRTGRSRTTRATNAPDPNAGPAITLPVVLVPEAVVLPHISAPLLLTDERAEAAVSRAFERDRRILILVEQHAPEPPTEWIDRLVMGDDPFVVDTPVGMSPGRGGSPRATVGVIAELLHPIRRYGQPQYLVQGVARGVVESIVRERPYVLAWVREQPDVDARTVDGEAMVSAVIALVERYIALLPNIPDEVIEMVRSIEEPGRLADMVASSPEYTPAQRQQIIDVLDPLNRLGRVHSMLAEKLDVLDLRTKIESEAQASLDHSQREYYLREELRAIRRELGEGGEEFLADDLRERVASANMPEEVRVKALQQVDRLENQHPQSPEVGLLRTYIEWLLAVPWGVETEDNLDLGHAAAVLNEDHYGLERVKERILDFIAVRSLAGDKMKTPILCLVGPPGVGKTSLGKSIARALGRNYVRVSLGGVRDEAEIRGHRRTYVGALPGRIVKALCDAGSRNPVFVLDEVDKIGTDIIRGDPASAMLEVLDPEQNSSFADHYMEVPIDLSRVLFITTANLLDPIPPALRDRMEVIEISGYTDVEKTHIARGFLLPKMLESHGLTAKNVSITDAAVRRLIHEYTREAGVRNLERELGALGRRVARRVVGGEKKKVAVTPDALPTYLEIPRYEFGAAEERAEIGVATGVAYTEFGGSLLPIEVALVPGKGDVRLTGQLGSVMQESAHAAMTYARSRAGALGIDETLFETRSIHVHVPEGAVPKDGPSAGVTLATALISAVTGRAVRHDLVMTGEITLRGKVLPIGGLKEKMLAAHRAGIRTFLMPRRNAKDLADIPAEVRDAMEIVQVERMEEILALALLPREPAAPITPKPKRSPRRATNRGAAWTPPPVPLSGGAP
jgi:ATP-dependent Lon protease